MANPRGQQDLGDLAFTPAEAAAIAQAEALGQAAPPPAPPRRRWGRGVGLALLACAGLFLLFYEPWPPPQRVAPPAAPSAVLKSGATVAIARRAVRLRREPSLAAPSLGVIPAGSLLTVAEQRYDGFHRVSYGAQVGYAAGAYLNVVSALELIAPTAGRVAAMSGTARLRERPSLVAAVCAGLPAGSLVTLHGYTQSAWVLVSAPAHTAFIWGGLVDASPALPFRPGRDGNDAVVVYGERILRPSAVE